MNRIQFLALATLFIVPAFAEDGVVPVGCGGPDGTLAKLAGKFAQANEGRRAAQEAKIGTMTERIVDTIASSDSADKLTAAVEALRNEFAVKPDSATSEVMAEKIGKLETYGTDTKKMLGEVLDISEQLGAIDVMASKDGWLVWAAKKVPYLKNRVKDSQEKNMTGREAMANLTTVVENRIKENKRMEGLAKKDEMAWREEYQQLWERAEVLQRVREAVKATEESLDGLTEMQKRGFELFQDELQTAEQVYRDLAVQLQEQVQANLVIQKQFQEGTKTLQTETKSQIRQLDAALANLAAADSAAKGFELAQKVKEAAAKTSTRVSQQVKQKTDEMIAAKRAAEDKTAFEEAQKNRRDAQSAWDQHDAEAAALRQKRIEDAKKRYASGEDELQKHDVRASVSAATITGDLVNQAAVDAPVVEVIAEMPKTKRKRAKKDDKPIYDSMPQ